MTGTTLSHYDIIEELGRGGMGIVYLAEDTKLDRQVAIKVLPSSALASEDDRARFYREAKAAAALNHPNIAQIYQIDEAVPVGKNGEPVAGPDEKRPFIAMEYIDGEPLDERIARGPLPLKDALRIARQIAGALGAAHESGIVHRDIKSANVILTNKGDAKVLDFGLALTAASTKLTRMGSTLGTVAYMSPEQARGEEVDRRTDLWALGVVLYEMVAGRHPFGGDYEQAVVYSILNTDPEPLTAIRTGVPMQLEWIENKCLAKSTDARYQSAADLIVDLNNLDLESGSGTASAHSTAYSAASSAATGDSHDGSDATERTVPLWAVAVMALLVGAASHWGIRSLVGVDKDPEPLTRVEISFEDMRGIGFPKLSPSRDWLLFRASDMDGRSGLFLRNMATGSIRYIENSDTGAAREAGFSPDGSRIAFTQGPNGGVFTAVVPSGIPERLTDQGRYAFWEDEDTIVMSDDRFGGGDSYRVFLDGREPERIEVEDPRLPEGYTNVLKTHIPGTDIAFGHQLVRLENGNLAEGAPNLFALDMASGELTIIESNAINPEYVGRGFLMYQLRDDDGRLVVRPVDPSTGTFTGQPMDVLREGETVSWSNYGVTTDGDLFYLPGNRTSSGTSSLWLVDMAEQTARNLSTVFPPGQTPQLPRFAPNGERIVFVAAGPDESQIHGYDIEKDLSYQYTFDGRNGMPVFGPDGRFVYFTTVEDSYFTTVEDSSGGIFRLPADPEAGREAETVLTSIAFPALSSDGRWLAGLQFSDGAEPHGLALFETASKTRVWSDTVEAVTIHPDFSPDDRYVAFTTLSEDQTPGIIVRSTGGSERFVIPGDFGTIPRWSPDGQYLYYAGPSSIYRLPVRTRPTFSITGSPENVLTAPANSGFDVSPDGESLVVAAPTVEILDGSSTTPVLVWMQNWSAHLEREVRR